jgi:hypothetical protein
VEYFRVRCFNFLQPPHLPTYPLTIKAIKRAVQLIEHWVHGGIDQHSAFMVCFHDVLVWWWQETESRMLGAGMFWQEILCGKGF